MIQSKLYEDYPEHPYIAPTRDLEDWEAYPEKYPYSKVERVQMIRLEEGVLPGDIIMLWRIGFDNFTNDASIPNYFEYRYGVDSDVSIQTLIDKGYVYQEDAKGSLDLLSMPLLKRILDLKGLKKSGNKRELLDRVLASFDAHELEHAFTLRRYRIQESGTLLLKKYNAIIQKHGPKEY